MWCLGKFSTFLLLIVIQQTDPWELIKECKFAEARSIIAEALSKPEDKDLPELYYLSALVSQDPETTRYYLKKVLENTNAGYYYFLAQLELSKIDYIGGNYHSVVRNLKKVIKGSQNVNIKSEAYFWLGLAQLELDSDEGRSTLKKVLKEYPLSRWAARARTIIGGSSKEYSVQTGAFKNESNALRLKEDITQYGFNVTITEKEIGDDLFYRVLVVGFQSLEEGLRLVDSLKILGFPEARVVSY